MSMEHEILKAMSPHEFANPLGCTSMVETEDGYIVGIQRSLLVSENPGLYSFPGGHPEPLKAGIIHNLNDFRQMKENCELFYFIFFQLCETYKLILSLNCSA